MQNVELVSYTSKAGNGSLEKIESIQRVDPPPTAANKNVESEQADKQFWYKSKYKVAGLYDCQAKNDALSTTLKQVAAKQPSAGPGEPFHIIWQSLSFEVKLGAYERLVNKISNGFWFSNRTDKQVGLSALEKRTIFKNLNGFANSGQITAILGPSGAGKTSLLNAICGTTRNYRGSIQLVGAGQDRLRLSLIPQRDHLNENLTVRENLLYASKILNSSKGFDHDENIMRVAKMVNLVNCLDSTSARISGGECKRVSIAQELLRQSDILVLDEPTTGLDSLNCKKLIKSLMQLIEASQRGEINPIAIIMTIHQPDVEIYQMFDHVYCMARQGRVIFDGHPRDTLRVLREQSGIPESQLLPDNNLVNPANLLIEIASEDQFGQEPIEKLARFQRWQFLQRTTEPGSARKISKGRSDSKLKQISNSFDPVENSQSNCELYCSKSASNSSLYSICEDPLTNSYANLDRMNDKLFDQANNEAKQHSLSRDKRIRSQNNHEGQFWYHTYLLASRSFKSTIRDPFATLSAVLFHIMLPFVIRAVYHQRIGQVNTCPRPQREMDIVALVKNDTLDMIDRQHEQMLDAIQITAMFFITTYSMSMCTMIIAALVFPVNMHILLKEVRNSWYSLPSYLFAKTVSSFPFEVLLPAISIIMIYQLLDLPSSYLEWRMWTIVFVIMLVSMISNAQGLAFGALCMDNTEAAIFLTSASSLPLLLLAGFTARVKQMPVVLQWLSLLSMYRHSTDSINLIRFGFNMCPCDETVDEYLRTNRADFVDVEPAMRSLLNYYLVSNSNQPGRLLSDSSTSNPLNVTDSGTLKDHLNTITGISTEFLLNPTVHDDLLRKIDNGEVNLFGRLAMLTERVFTFGFEVNDCHGARSVWLRNEGNPGDNYLPYHLGGLMVLLVLIRVILFIIVKLKVRARV